MTGGARGLCGSGARRQTQTDSDGNFFRGGLGGRRGFGGRRGGGFGRGLGVAADPDSAGPQSTSRESLEYQVSELQKSLEKLQRRLDER